MPDPQAPASSASPGATPPAAGPPPPRPQPHQQDEAIDLGATVLPVLLRAYWKPVVAVIAAVAAIIWWVVGRD